MPNPTTENPTSIATTPAITNADPIFKRLKALKKITGEAYNQATYDQGLKELAKVVNSSAAEEILQHLRALKGTETQAEWRKFFGQLKTYNEKCIQETGSVMKSGASEEDKDKVTVLGADDLAPMLLAALYKAGATAKDSKKLDTYVELLYKIEGEKGNLEAIFGISSLSGEESNNLTWLLGTLAEAQKLTADDKTTSNINNQAVSISAEEFSTNLIARSKPMLDFLNNLRESIALINPEITRLEEKQNTNPSDFRRDKIMALKQLKKDFDNCESTVKEIPLERFLNEKPEQQEFLTSSLEKAYTNVHNYSHTFKEILAKIVDVLSLGRIEIFKNQAKDHISHLSNFWSKDTQPQPVAAQARHEETSKTANIPRS